MRTRRIAASACTLFLAIPAAAGASPATNPTRTEAPPAVTSPGPQSTVKAKGPYGIVPPGPRSTVKAKGPYGIVLPGPRSTVKAKGPYGIVPPGPGITTKGINAPLHPHAAGASHGHGTDGWRAAAAGAAALLAALALGYALVLPARRRPARMVT